MENLRLFNVTYVPFTTFRPARVKVYDCRNRVTRFVSYHNDLSDRVEEIGQRYLENLGISVIFVGQGTKGFILGTRNFETQIK